MRPCTPMTAAPSATGRQLQKSQKAQACPKASPNRSRHRYADPRTATLHVCAKLRPKAVFSFGPCTARFLFHKMEKKMGGALPSYQHSCFPGQTAATHTSPPDGEKGGFCS